MTNPPPQNSQPPSMGFDDGRSKIFDSKLVNTDVPRAIAGFAISQSFEGNWIQFGSLMAAAIGSWFLIKIGNKLAPKVDTAMDQAGEALGEKAEKTLARLTGLHQQYFR